MSEQITDLTEPVMPASSMTVQEARAAGGAAGRAAADAVVDGKIDKDGVGQVSMANLSSDVRKAMTGGSVAVVGDDGVSWTQLASDLRKPLESIAGMIWNQRNADTDDAWAVNSGTVSYRTGATGWSAANMDVAEGTVHVVRLRTTGTTPGIIMTDRDFKVLKTACVADADGKTVVWQDTRVTIPSGTAHVMVNMYGAATLAQAVRLLGPDMLAAHRGWTADFDHLTDTRNGLLADITDLRPFLTFYVAWTKEHGFAFQATESAPNAGLVTNTRMTSASNRVLVHVEGESDLEGIVIQAEITHKADGSVEYMPLDRFRPDGPFVRDAWFDASNAAVYHDMASFRVFVQSTKGAGWCTLSTFDVSEKPLDGVRNNGLYAPTLAGTLGNVFARLDEHDNELSAIAGGVAGGVLTSPSGARYTLAVGDDGTLRAVPHTPTNVLVLGNSITLGLDTNNEHGGAFGLCASAPANDWCNQTVEAIRGKNPKTKVDKLHCAVFEQAEETETADAWIEANRQTFAGRDLIVLQIGDNANNATRRAVFAGSLPRLVRAMRSASPGARIVLLGVWYAHADTIKALTDTASSCGAELVRINDLAVSANMGVKGQTITYADGSSVTAMDNWITHPGDRGMRLIADRLVAALDM